MNLSSLLSPTTDSESSTRAVKLLWFGMLCLCYLIATALSKGVLPDIPAGVQTISGLVLAGSVGQKLIESKTPGAATNATSTS